MFTEPLRTFSERLRGLRDFVSVIAPFLHEKCAHTARSHKSHLSGVVLAVLKVFPEALASHGVKVDDPKLVQRIESMFDGKLIQSESGQLTLQPTEPEKFAAALKQLFQNMEQVSLLHESALISLISSSEFFFGQLLHTYYERFPEAAPIDDKQMTFADLKSFDSVDDARQFLISSQIEGVVRQRVLEWPVLAEMRLDERFARFCPPEAEAPSQNDRPGDGRVGSRKASKRKRQSAVKKRLGGPAQHA